jgi:hypothetical protein
MTGHIKRTTPIHHLLRQVLQAVAEVVRHRIPQMIHCFRPTLHKLHQESMSISFSGLPRVTIRVVDHLKESWATEYYGAEGLTDIDISEI